MIRGAYPKNVVLFFSSSWVGLKYLQGTNTLAYFKGDKVSKKKPLIKFGN
jgi:hypothetical protein